MPCVDLQVDQCILSVDFEKDTATGKKVVLNITCRRCATTLGWIFGDDYESMKAMQLTESRYNLEPSRLCRIHKGRYVRVENKKQQQKPAAMN